jgi:simple sugar transport system permease protein
VFGFGDSLSFRGPAVVRSLILAVAIGLFAAAVYAVTRTRIRTAVIQALVAIGFLAFFLTVQVVPNQLLTATPYLITLLVLAAASQRLRMPAADGARYAKGEPR